MLKVTIEKNCRKIEKIPHTILERLTLYAQPI